jgi:hypothetical protein
LVVVVDPGEVRPPLTLCHRDKAVEGPRGLHGFFVSRDRKKGRDENTAFLFA